MTSSVDHPAHYGGDTVYEVVKVVFAWKLDFVLGNVVKYIVRSGKKPDIPALEDLRKAAWYLNWYVEELERESDASP